jgi:hypothetical protein
VTRTQGRATFRLGGQIEKKKYLGAKIQKIKQIRGKNDFILFFLAPPLPTLYVYTTERGIGMSDPRFLGREM